RPLGSRLKVTIGCATARLVAANAIPARATTPATIIVRDNGIFALTISSPVGKLTLTTPTVDRRRCVEKALCDQHHLLFAPWQLRSHELFFADGPVWKLGHDPPFCEHDDAVAETEQFEHV